MCNNVYMIHNRIAVFRTDLGLSRQELASMAGVNYQTIGFIERGDYSPSLELAFKLAEVFGVDITDVFSDKPFKPLNERNT
ncbi:helix-turn-helix transcriptional regulator [Candidatus Saccharibacteria bacterium]|nr:helix-turn-helix transcriptional regulator [Candidatus Saccharibacteria bacterium]